MPLPAGGAVQLQPEDDVQNHEENRGDEEIEVNGGVENQRRNIGSGLSVHNEPLQTVHEVRKYRDHVQKEVKIGIDNGETGEGIQQRANEGIGVLPAEPPHIQHGAHHTDGEFQQCDEGGAVQQTGFGEHGGNPGKGIECGIVGIGGSEAVAQEGIPAPGQGAGGNHALQLQEEGDVLGIIVSPVQILSPAAQKKRQKGQQTDPGAKSGGQEQPPEAGAFAA